VDRSEHEFGAGVDGGQNTTVGHGEWRSDGDPAAHPWFRHVESDDRTERVARDPGLVIANRREEVDGRGNVEELGMPAVVFATARADSSEIETKTVKTEGRQVIEQHLDHRVETVAAVERMWMGQRDRTEERTVGRSEVADEFHAVDGRESHRVDGHGTTVP